MGKELLSRNVTGNRMARARMLQITKTISGCFHLDNMFYFQNKAPNGLAEAAGLTNLRHVRRREAHVLLDCTNRNRGTSAVLPGEMLVLPCAYCLAPIERTGSASDGC